jgi:3-methylcrotonyl-CoA carboxylase alpha subunit
VLIEKYILNPRHIEVQVFGDSHGNLVHLFERDCSLQRRHQKVIEEAPAPGMDEATREAICATAVRAARAVDYVGAGTIEFIADASEGLSADRIFFMEMNTRLQVEHPVTEEITGVDLVEWQLRVASGEKLPLQQAELAIDGWAMEARLYAEDPVKGFLPSIGALELFELEGPARTDTGVEQGTVISPFYDPMIAKVIAHGTSRNEAREQLAQVLRDAVIWPVRTNAGFLVRALDHPAFAAGTLDTGLIAREGDDLMPPARPSEAALADAVGALVGKQPLAGFRLNAPPQRSATILLDGAPVSVEGLASYDDGARSVVLSEAGQSWELTLWRVDRIGAGGAADGSIIAPMPGRVIAVEVAEGELVTKGQKLLTLEAMKMEHVLAASFDGTVVALNIAMGAQVSQGALLVRIEAENP